MNGLILIDKETGCTSHDVVLSVRKLVQQKKVGHFGTLDPQATGLLIIALGKATRFFPYYLKSEKHYTGTMRLGFATDSYDAEGTPTSKITTDFPSETDLQQAIRTFTGRISQFPPPFSAKKYKGKPLYSLARRNKPVPLISSEVTVYSWTISGYDPPFFHFDIRCASGTYIRSLAHDVGRLLGCGGHLFTLRRVQIGSFNVSDALSLEELKTRIKNDERSSYLLPIESLLDEFSTVILNSEGVLLAGNGNSVSSHHILRFQSGTGAGRIGDDKTTHRLFSEDHRFIALSRRDEKKDCFHPFLVIETGNNED